MNDVRMPGRNAAAGKKENRQGFFIDVGVIDVPTADGFIADLTTLRRKEKIPDVLLFLAHSPCLSVGARQLNKDDFLKPLDFFSQHGIPLYKTVRGGGLTFHWPGQLICYPVLKLAPEERNIPQYMFHLEEIGLRTLADIGVQASRKRDKTAQIGLWVGDNKIASMGIRISQWVTSYGFALNLDGDATMSRFIRPCGLDADLVTVEQQTGAAPARAFVREKVLTLFAETMNRSFVPPDENDNEIRKVLKKYGIDDKA